MNKDDIPSFMELVKRSLNNLNKSQPYSSRPTGEPAVPIEESITPDYLICLEDGRKLKMLKRHLRKVYNMTPYQYRERWNLPANYPMVSPNYSKRRTSIAKHIGLGTHRKSQKKVAA
jgi:predicted transcriptional regulator